MAVANILHRLIRCETRRTDEAIIVKHKKDAPELRIGRFLTSMSPCRKRVIWAVRPLESMRYSIMKLPVTFTVFEIVWALLLILGPMNARGDESKSHPVSDRVRAKLEALSPAAKGKVAEYLKDRKAYKQLLMAPYSQRLDVHMWVMKTAGLTLLGYHPSD